MIDKTFRERFIFHYKEQIGFSTVDFGKRTITYFGYASKQFQIDNGAELTNFSKTKRVHIFDKFCIENVIEHKLIRPRTPCHNGKVERSHHSDQEALQKILCKSKSSQTIGGLQSKRDLGFPLNSHVPVSWNGMRAEGVNTITVCEKNIKRGNWVTRILYPRTLSKVGWTPYPNFDMLRSNAQQCFSTQDTKFFPGCHRW